MASFVTEFKHLEIQLEDIKSATNNFDESKVTGGGGFGKVYAGELSHSQSGEKSLVAIKRLDRRYGQGDPEFFKEIRMLSSYRHENLISLLGFCCQGGEMILIYEYASRGSLDRLLSSAALTWTQRLRICLDAAKGLSFLHDPNGTQQRVLHCDIKSANILLDKNMTAKVSDFGLSKIGPANQQYSLLITSAVGTPGYCDPLYMQMYFLTKESDVYSFGVVLFEVMCGRLCAENSNGRLNVYVPFWRKSYEENKLYEIILQDLRQQMDPSSLKTFSDIASQCLRNAREERPTMSRVVEELEIALESQEFPDLRLELLTKYEDILMAVDPLLIYKTGKQLKQLLSKGLTIKGKTVELPVFEEYQYIIEAASQSLVYRSLQDLKQILSRGVHLNGYKTVEDQVSKKDKVEDIQTVSDSESDTYWEQKLPNDYEEILNLSKDSLKWTTKKELYSILRRGFLIDNGQQWLAVDKHGKKCLMLSASATWVTDDKNSACESFHESRFGEVIVITDAYRFAIKWGVHSKLVSPETTYAAYLVYKLPQDQSTFEAPIGVNGVNADYSSRYSFIYLVSPPHTPIIGPKFDENTYNPLNRYKGNAIPQQRNDGWMEVKVWEFQTTTESVRLQLFFKDPDYNRKNLSGLTIQGIELRPI
ncbi:Phloem protein 2-like protein [Artemisia annua]|uniref:Phloem protein 2-like protein n=1 Tax=Artemisia annua TaxID=35608 RepID=A0A2U1KML9_ARTAN|nr:Phloem protein 2-like protein [Artemisia annua]